MAFHIYASKVSANIFRRAVWNVLIVANVWMVGFVAYVIVYYSGLMNLQYQVRNLPDNEERL